MMDYVLGRLMAPFQAILLPEDRLYLGYLLFAVLLASQSGGKWRLPRIAKLHLYFFSTHLSAWLDVRFFIVNRILFGLFLAPFFAAWESLMTIRCHRTLIAWFPEYEGMLSLPAWSVDLSLTFLTLIALDFGFFVSHWLQHKVPALWTFHQVHHSAEVLTPITAYRVHPVDDLLALALSGGCAGLVQGMVQTFSPGNGHVLMICGVHIGLVLFYLAGFNLRHSSAWFSYGAFWSQWFISPAQHRIHHSLDPQHFDKNFGFIFACWDRIAGTLFVPIQAQRIRVGLSGVSYSDADRYQSVWHLYSRPFFSLWKKPRSRVIVLLILLIFIELVWINTHASIEALSPKSVFLEELTSPEIKQRIESGYDTLLIPTGGIEQNGMHLVLGKHNVVLHYTSEQIAQQLGHTLVAPIVPIVPEGEWDPPSGHMQFAGTLGLSSPTFQAVLTEIAQSAIAHGFRYICFIGEHGESQHSQLLIADQFNRLRARSSLQAERVQPSDSFPHALHVDHYYQDAEQRAWLRAKGETEETIGHHAGIIDTSELMAVAPQWVSLDSLAALSDQSNYALSFDGLPNHASASYGRVFLDMKVRHAVEQIQAWKKSLS